MNTTKNEELANGQSVIGSVALGSLIKHLDAAMDVYLTSLFGVNWRSMCHQSARIAATALNIIEPALDAKAIRVELLAKMMGDHHRLVHIGWANDSAVLLGKAPMHFAVQFGDALYDPTFWQLSRAKTPLDLPPQPYFSSEKFCGEVWRRDSMNTVVQAMPSGILRVVYKLVDHPRDVPFRTQMTEENVTKHAQHVVNTIKNSKIFELLIPGRPKYFF